MTSLLLLTCTIITMPCSTSFTYSRAGEEGEASQLAAICPAHAHLLRALLHYNAVFLSITDIRFLLCLLGDKSSYQNIFKGY